jgi:hypothetical protein
MFVTGLNGQIELTDSSVIIKRKGFLAVVSKGFSGDKTIPINAITSIQFKRASFFTGNGFIKFCFGGAVEKQGNLKEAVNDENAVVFTSKSNEAFEKLKDEIERRKSKPLTAPVHVSVADEIEKLAKLKENGHLTEDEFNEKKKELLAKI